VIIASFLPIYVLAGPSGKLFEPMADTTIFALIGALIVTLTLLPCLCAWLLSVRHVSGAIRLRVDARAIRGL
jgi:cobalt-zinc-cadmium resistance protein CzcA